MFRRNKLTAFVFDLPGHHFPTVRVDAIDIYGAGDWFARALGFVPPCPRRMRRGETIALVLND